MHVHCVLGVSSTEPSFDVPIVNVTVVAGQNIVLHCSIDRIGKYKVSAGIYLPVRSAI